MPLWFFLQSKGSTFVKHFYCEFSSKFLLYVCRCLYVMAALFQWHYLCLCTLYLSLSFVFLFCLLSVFACYCRPVSVPISRLLQNTDLIANSIPAFVSKSFFYNFYQKDNFYQNTFQREAYLEHEMNDSASYWILDHTCNVCTFQMSIPQIRFSCTSF